MVEAQETQLITLSELNQHSSPQDCWISAHSKVWDITHFIREHPGGPAVLLKCAGTNATASFDEVHAPDIIGELPKDKFKGFLEQPSPDTSATPPDTEISTPPPRETQSQMASSVDVPAQPEEEDVIPPLEAVLAAPDLAAIAKKALTPKAWAFYSSAATDLITYGKNKELVQRLMIRPRMLRNVKHVSFERDILGFKSRAPFFISPTAMARLAHPDGDLAVARGASNEGIIQCISSNASYTLKSIVNAAPPEQPFFFQLYVNSERQRTADLLRTVRDLGIKAIFVTVDAPVPGKREADERAAQAIKIFSAISGGESSKDKKGSGLGRLMAQVQASIPVLLELHKNCPEVFESLEVYSDGGFERGSDILKAICLCATAVGVGRPYLYSLVYGQDGVEHLTQMLKDELEVSMRLCGITSLDQANPSLDNTLDIEHLVTSGDRVEPISRMHRLSKL